VIFEKQVINGFNAFTETAASITLPPSLYQVTSYLEFITEHLPKENLIFNGILAFQIKPATLLGIPQSV
jgi:hypothetical protein